MSEFGINRRAAIQALLAISAAGALEACKKVAKPQEVGDLDYARPGKFLNTNEMVLLSVIAQIIIPKTDTAGAVEAEVPDALQSLMSDWGDDNFRQYWREGLRELGRLLKVSGQSFANAEADAQQMILSKFDNDIFSGVMQNDFYKDMKFTIATAYYMSESGATKELNYDPVPGEWRGCVPFADIGKAWAI